MKTYMIGPSEMDAEMFEATSYADAMNQARGTFGRWIALCCFGQYALEPVL